MANTEGMPDEFVESLATAGSAMYSHREEQRLRARLRQKRMEERMNLPPGGSPAAKIIRPSRNNGGKTNAHEAKPSEVNPPSPSVQPYESNGLPMIGEIIEHEPNRSQQRKNESARKASRFAFRNRKNDHVTGFPSVHNAPIGTFVKNKKNKKGQESNKLSKKQAMKKPQAGLKDSTIGSIGSHDQMKEASRRDSEAMLAGMTRDEIESHQQDIEQALSSDMIAFLKKRRKQKTEIKNKQPTVPDADVTADNDNNTDAAKRSRVEDGNEVCSVDGNRQSLATQNNNTSIKENTIVENRKTEDEEEDAGRKEKERIAKLVSSIKTHEDLDATYRAEMKRNVFGTDSENVDTNRNGNNKKETFLVACDLLRSTSARQTLWASKTVTLELEHLMTAGRQENEKELRKGGSLSAEANQQVTTIEDIPSILSVSLRCLLDKPLNSSCNYLLHTYALQSLYYLVTIYAHPDHDMLCDNSALRACSGIYVYQDDYMDDAVPSPSLDTAYPPMSVQPLAAEEKSGADSAAAYMTSSATSSAVADGEDFKKDPMWTLLSKMKIIPRLAFLLESQQHMVAIPTEALTAICGILSMLGQRSPGAASAIVQHKTLTSLLLKRMLEQIQHGYSETERNEGTDRNRDRIILTTIRLFCILSRQSRFVAEALPLEDILPPLLAAGIASSHQQFLVQQHALFLWRTLLRYGLGTEALASMLTISARHLALPYSNKYSLSSDLLSSFTLVIECVKVVWSKNIDASSTGVWIRGREESLMNIVARNVESATVMMASTLQTVVPKNLSSENSLNNTPNTSESLTLRHRWNASRLLYVSAWFQLFDSKLNGKTDKLIEDYIPLHRQETLLLTIQAWTEPRGELEKAWRLIPKWCDSSLGFRDFSERNAETMRKEATACAFINAYFTISLVLLRSKSSNLQIEEIKRSLHKRIVAMMMICLKSTLKNLAAASSSGSSGTEESRSSSSSAREKWINQCQFAVAKFCFYSISMGQIGTSSDMLLVRSLVFSLLGRLGKGDESIAAVLFSSDVLFQSGGGGDPVGNEEIASAASSSSSPVSSMFLGELCGSEVARKQLDHSFKLQHGFGITSAGFGPFQLESLLCNAESPNAPPSSASSSEDGPSDEPFPLGRLWLWQCLSGSIRMRDDGVASGTEEAADVIAAVLGLITDLEETEEANDTVGYAGRLPVGSKLYYLMNVCLHHERVLRDERVLNRGEILLDRYLRSFGRADDDDDVVVFCRECLEHSGFSSLSSSKNGTKKDEKDDDDALDAIDEKILDRFSSALTIDLRDPRVPSEAIRAMIAFLEDLTAAYRDYGAQYDFFTKCIRVLLLPVFPSPIRCRGLRELDGMLHLLTVSNEVGGGDENGNEDENERLRALLSKSLTGGLPAVDGSVRDDTDFLNAVSKAVTAASPRPPEGYMRHYCVGVLARNLAISLTTGNGVEISGKRLKRSNAKIVRSVCDVTDRFLRCPRRTKSALVEAVVSSSSSSSCDPDDDDDVDTDIITAEQQAVRCIDSCIARNLDR